MPLSTLRISNSLINMALKYALVLVALLAGQGFAQGCENWNTSMFFLSATLGEVVDCLEAGADVNARNPGGFTPLHLAFENTDNPAVIRVLIEAGADVNARNPGGFTPLHLAARYTDDATLIWILADAGADVNAKAESGATPLRAAVTINCNIAVVDALVAAGANFQDLDASEAWLSLVGGGCRR